MSTFWWENLRVLVDPDKAGAFVPTPDMPLAEKLNAVARFALYFSVLLIMIKQSVHHAYVFIFVALCTIAIYYSDRSREQYDDELQQRLRVQRMRHHPDRYAYRPTADNPFMNVSLQDMDSFPTRPPAANIRRPEVRGEVHRLYADSFPVDEDDVYGARSSERQFYTMPSTTIPNDQDTFARWLYKTGKTFKESHLHEN